MTKRLYSDLHAPKKKRVDPPCKVCGCSKKSFDIFFERIKKSTSQTVACLLLKTKAKKRVNLVNRNLSSVGYQTTECAHKITHLFLGNNRITSLRGIENFKSLKSLSCANNLVTSQSKCVTFPCANIIENTRTKCH